MKATSSYFILKQSFSPPAFLLQTQDTLDLSIRGQGLGGINFLKLLCSRNVLLNDILWSALCLISI